MSVQNLEVTTESILSAVVRMPEKEVEQLFRDAKRLKQREAQLIDKIRNLGFSPEQEKLYRRLLQNFRAEKITREENQELIKMTDKLEEIAAERLEWIYEISQMRQQSVDDIMKELKIKPKNYG